MTLKNYWLDLLAKKRLYKEIDEIGLEVWAEDGNFGEFLELLNDEQSEFLMNMSIRDFFADSNDFSFGIELIAGDS